MNPRLQPYLLVALGWAFYLASFSVSAQGGGVFEGDLRLTTQAEVDAFNYQSVGSLCIHIDGSLTDPITNLKALCSLKSIANNLTISAIGVPQLSSLEGLHGITSIGGNFNIEAADISSMKGLENLKTIGGQLSVYRTPLISFQGLGSLTTIDGAFVLNDIASGDEPISFQGLSVLQSVGGIIFTDKDVLAEDFTGLESLKIIRGSLSIGGTEVDGVSSLKGLEGVEEITGDIQFSYERFTNFEGLNNLQRLGGGIILEDNAIESFYGLEKLEVIEGQIVALNNRINNVKGLRSLQTAGGIDISDEPLGSLDGLEQLRQVDGSLGFNYTRITRVTSLQGIERIAGNLSLVGNSDLTECCIIPSLLERVEGEVTIADNAPACSSREAIAENCDESVAGVDCSQEEIILTTQTEVNAFDCTTTNNLTINVDGSSTDPITNLKALSSLVSINDDLIIQSSLDGETLLESLEGLENLENVRGELYFLKSGVKNLEAFESLRSVGAFRIEDEPRITSLKGLMIQQVTNNDFVVIRTQVEDISATENIESIVGDAVFIDNPNLVQCCVIPTLLERVGGTVFFYGNATGCNSLEQIEENCGEPPVAEIDCSQEEVVLTTQAQVDAFNCTRVSSLTIDGEVSVTIAGEPLNTDPITNLASLSSLTTIDNDLTIRLAFNDSANANLGLSNLTMIGGNFEFKGNTFNGLDKLTQIGGSLNLDAGASNTNFEGLEQLESISRGFNSYLSNFVSFEGLSNLKTIGSGIFIRSHNKRFSFKGLSALEQVEGFSIFGSDVIDFAGLSSLEKIGFLKVIESGVSSYEGLNNLKEITGDITFTDAGSGSWAGLNNLRRVGGNIAFRNSITADFIGLESLEEIGGNLDLDGSLFTNFEGLPSLRSVKSVILFELGSLSSVNGIQELKIDGNFSIYDTPIDDITALQNIDIITGDLRITENSGLSTCCVIPAIADRVQGSIILERNAPTCSSLEAIAENCDEEAPDENARTAHELKAFPNPSANFVQIQVDQPTVVQLFSTTGNLVKEQRVEQEGTLDLTTVKAGVYLLKAPGRKVQRIIKK